MSQWICGLSLLLSLAACDRRELTYVYHPYCDMKIRMDWSDLGELPSGMSLYAYPEDGSAPHLLLTNEVNEAELSLRSGRYHLVAFNQSVDEFGSLFFQGMDKFGTAEADVQEKTFSWLTSKSSTNHTVCDPEPFASTYMELDVTDDMVEHSQTIYALKLEGANLRSDSSFTYLMKPIRHNWTGNIEVYIQGIQNIKSVRGYLTGLAEGSLLSTHTNTANMVTHVMEDWTIKRDSSNYTTGRVTTEFQTFGLPGAKGITKARDAKANRLYLSFLLVDNKTIVNYIFDVGDRIEELEEHLVLNLRIGVKVNPDDPDKPGPDDPDKPDDPDEPSNPDKPIVVPDVKPEGGSSSGFDVTVDDWGEEEFIDIDL